MNFIFVLILLSLASIVITFILSLLFKKIRYIKYIPAFVLFLFMIYNFITMYSATNEGFESLGKFVMGILLLIACVSSLITSIVFDSIHRKNNREK